jgi:hypothetical protein
MQDVKIGGPGQPRQKLKTLFKKITKANRAGDIA